jgi:pimeloyl-ACP methyl ester carboxylesterase
MTATTSAMATHLDERQPRSHYARVLGREVHWVEWGSPSGRPVVMWHGLARTGRDFDEIGAALADRFRVICPDTIGRGHSEWSSDPDADYCLAHYAALAAGLADHLGLGTFDWVGTSMGGALGIRAAATTLKSRLGRVVINDIGPTFPPAPYERIKTYIGNPPEFDTVSALETYFQTIYKPFGPHTPAQWRHMAETSMRRLPSGRITTHYDPKIVRQMFVHPRDYEQWEHWDAMRQPTLVLRGVESDLLLGDVAREMTMRGPKARIVEISGCGHAPPLNTAHQIGVVRAFLEG